ncbi:unnamed protein product, partial [Tetraodon nigroviridis]
MFSVNRTTSAPLGRGVRTADGPVRTEGATVEQLWFLPLFHHLDHSLGPRLGRSPGGATLNTQPVGGP